MESAQAKNQALREAGAVVPTSYEAFEAVVKETFEKLVSFCFGQRSDSSMQLAIFTYLIGVFRLKKGRLLQSRKLILLK